MPLTGEYVPSPEAWVRNQVELIESSGGTKGSDYEGHGVVLLTTVGAKSGKIRKNPLMRVEHDGVYAVVASQGGLPKNPTWYFNLKANPQAELRDATEVWDVTAREVTGEERQLWWDRSVEAWPAYAEYQTKTDRVIPVFVLDKA